MNIHQISLIVISLVPLAIALIGGTILAIAHKTSPVDKKGWKGY